MAEIEKRERIEFETCKGERISIDEQTLTMTVKFKDINALHDWHNVLKERPAGPCPYCLNNESWLATEHKCTSCGGIYRRGK